ncbi:hypothetical protein Leryth_024966, partial [Lithospermum erythrorhizon]
ATLAITDTKRSGIREYYYRVYWMCQDLTQEELIENYQQLFSKWSKLTSVFTVNEAEKERLTKENDELKKLVEILRNEVMEWESKVKGFGGIVSTTPTLMSWMKFYEKRKP